MASLPPIPEAFAAKKATILKSLSADESSYTDLSPKGTVDEAIRGLIDRINALEGVVTTSSCAGRMSVFFEGRKHSSKLDRKMDDGNDMARERQDENQATVPGGKGMGGRWLFVSHEPVQKPNYYPSRLFGLEPMKGVSWDVEDEEPSKLKVARFQFEPMILHIMTASLHHAQPILAAAINAGFRESGVQSLKNLEDANAFPMVAIRSAGLALESVLGANHDSDEEPDGFGVCSMVSEEYCEMLRKIGNERFRTNTERMRRFESELFKRGAKGAPDWEASEARKERKRAEGLMKQDYLRRGVAAQHSSVDIDNGQKSGTLSGAFQTS